MRELCGDEEFVSFPASSRSSKLTFCQAISISCWVYNAGFAILGIAWRYVGIRYSIGSVTSCVYYRNSPPCFKSSRSAFLSSSGSKSISPISDNPSSCSPELLNVLWFDVACIVFPWKPAYIHFYFQLHLVDSISKVPTHIPAQQFHTSWRIRGAKKTDLLTHVDKPLTGYIECTALGYLALLPSETRSTSS